MENVWETMFNLIFQNDPVIGFKFNVRQSCRAQRALSFIWRAFSNRFSKFWEKLKMKTYTIENLLDVTLSLTL